MKTSKNVKIVVFVPETHADLVREAIGIAGAGKIGNYSYCTYSSKGTGRFKPENGAHPAIGEVGKLESVLEERIEFVCDRNIAQDVIVAMKKVHPYEEVAFDVYPLEEIQCSFRSICYYLLQSDIIHIVDRISIGLLSQIRAKITAVHLRKLRSVVVNNMLKIGKYRHYKGKEYEVVGIAKHSETREDLVVYRALYGEMGLWVRPLEMFIEKVNIDGKEVPRFQYIDK